MIRMMKDDQVVATAATAEIAQQLLMDAEHFDGIHPDDLALFERMVELRPVRAWQFHAVLRASGLSGTLESALAGMDEPAQSIARARLEYSDTYDRFDPLVDQLGAAMEMAEGDLDDLWRRWGLAR